MESAWERARWLARSTGSTLWVKCSLFSAWWIFKKAPINQIHHTNHPEGQTGGNNNTKKTLFIYSSSNVWTHDCNQEPLTRKTVAGVKREYEGWKQTCLHHTPLWDRNVKGSSLVVVAAHETRTSDSQNSRELSRNSVWLCGSAELLSTQWSTGLCRYR